MEETLTWRTLLRDAIRSPHERQRLAGSLGVNPVTLTRWVNNVSHPRLDFLRALPAALPEVREHLIALIEQEHPDLFHREEEQQELEIPPVFYARFLHDYTTIPSQMRESSLCLQVVQHLLAQLDPSEAGMGIFIAQCTPPSWGKKVRSLYQTIGRGTADWEPLLYSQTQLFGAESQVGAALEHGHLFLVQTSEEKARWYPDQQMAAGESCVVVPILLADQAAGCLCAFSTQPAAFSSAQLVLLEDAARLLTLALAPERFYPLQEIILGLMPSLKEQRPFLATLQQRILDHLKDAAHQLCLLTYEQAERLVWQELEQGFLSLACSKT